MSSFVQRYHRRRFITWITILVVFAALLVLNVLWLGLGPPEELVISSGDPKAGAYDKFANQYKAQLDEMGLNTTVRPSKGSMENLDRLLNGDVDVAFVQSGLLERDKRDHSKLRALAAVYLSPVWVFYRKEIQDIERLADFSHLKINIGPEGSGTHVIASRLLDANGIDSRGDNIMSLSLAEASDALKKNEIQIAFFVITAQSPQVKDLISHEDVRMLDFRRSLAYSRRFPEFTSVTLGEGTVDLEDNVPDEEHRLIATSVILMGKEDLHARAVEQILIAAKKTHKEGDILSDPGAYPTLDRVTMPVHPAANQFMRSGESLTSKILPYAVMRWVLRVQLLIIPLIAIWLPLVKFFPAIYQFRINSLLRLHYGALRDVENRIEEAETPAAFETELSNLESLQTDMERLSRKIPAHLQCDVYNWRLHIGLVRDAALKRQGELLAKVAEENEQGQPSESDDAEKTAI